MGRYKDYNTSWVMKDRLINREKYMWKAARGSASKKGFGFDIDISDIKIPDTCPRLGIPLFFSEGKKTDNTPSLDRIDNSKGYVKGNISVVSWRFNRLKSDATFEELIKIGEWAQNQISP